MSWPGEPSGDGHHRLGTARTINRRPPLSSSAGPIQHCRPPSRKLAERQYFRDYAQCASTNSPSAGAGAVLGSSTPVTTAPITKIAVAHQKLVV